jgi:non-lysosomal glucosylceramidase
MAVSLSILGWLENKVSLRAAAPTDIRMNEVLTDGKLKTVQGSIKMNGSLLQLQEPDYGTLAIASLNGASKAITDLQFPVNLASFAQQNEKIIEKTTDQQLIGAVRAEYQIKPAATVEAHFSIAWHFANLKLNQAIQDKGRYYANWFSSASEVLSYVHQNFSLLSNTSKLWKDTWFDSSLPWWFLERTFSNISTMATTTAHRFRSGRFYAWEGVGCCGGTCTHVWQYAQAVGRIFPGIEKDTRERIDLGLSLQADGMIWYRGEVVKTAAIDGQAGTILRIYREHQMSADNQFLSKNWEKIKLATEWVIRQDKNQDGMEDTPIENTLDAVWDGEIAWLVGLCIAAVKAAAAMAGEMNDSEFEKLCKDYVSKGSRNMEEKLFNGEYFIHKPDEIKGREKLGSYNTCHIDQVYGQSWAHQVALGRIIDQEKTLKALQSLWKYNFTPDVGPYIKERTGGRPYALAGEGGLVMNTNPKNEERPYGDKITWQLGYFHECMSGFEHQVASHMMAEGMTEEAMVITRMIHDRYHAAKRNPFNEIECSDHYARAMASYGTFITACGFEYHGPNGSMAFDPKLNAEKFKAPFTAAAAWGSYQQQRGAHKLEASLVVQYGELSLKSFSLVALHQVSDIEVKLGNKVIPASISQVENRCTLKFSSTVRLVPGQNLSFKV